MNTLDEKGLREAEEARRLAMLGSDSSKLNDLFGEQLVYTHSTGGVDSKQSYLEKLSSGALRYDSMEFIRPQFRVIGSVGLVSASMQASVVRGDVRREVSNSYLAVWEHTASGWQLQVLHGTPLPPAA
jgi:Domain of unknown function (DUF4440)